MKTLLLNRYRELSNLFALSLLSILLLAVRMKITHDFYMLFLVWNLFLALLPYGISLWFGTLTKSITSIQKLKWIAVPVVLLWLLILPNAPYIITDLIHIRHASGSWLIYDSILISCFAITGCWTGFKSIHQMVTILTHIQLIKKDFLKRIIEYTILFLCALGIYLGRDLRWNSWDIIQHPDQLFIDTFAIFIHPLSHQTAWLQILPMIVFLMVLYKLFKHYEAKS